MRTHPGDTASVWPRHCSYNNPDETRDKFILLAKKAMAEKLGYVEFGRGHQVHYRDGGYVDESWVLMERTAWDERFGKTEREYVPFGRAR